MATVTRTLEDLPPLDEERIKKLKKMRDEDIDFSDMPALTQEQLARFVPAKLLNRLYANTCWPTAFPNIYN